MNIKDYLEESEGVVTFATERLKFIPTALLERIENETYIHNQYEAKRKLDSATIGLRRLILEVEDMKCWFGYGKKADFFYTRHLRYVISALRNEQRRVSDCRIILRYLMRGKTYEQAKQLLPER